MHPIPKPPFVLRALVALGLLFSDGIPGFSLASDKKPTFAPLAVEPGNHHYFHFRNHPAILLTSGEHYGALLNADFDFTIYFETLSADGFNLTRLFSGVYCEPAGAFKIDHNTLAPATGRLIAPFARSGSPGYANGGNKFDLTQWSPVYFKRLHTLMQSASANGIVVEFNFFCPFYRSGMWDLSPLNPVNQVHPLPPPKRANDIWTLDRSGPYLAIEESFVRKIVGELNRYDNLYYEVCNEPYQKTLPQDWHDHIAETIAAAEKNLPRKHLISWNVANHGEKAIITKPRAVYSIFNFHYSNPPDEVDRNWHLGRPIGDNETGFDGQANRPYRSEAWEFLLAGGALFNHLDYSFAAGGHENGTFSYPDHQPGGGNATLRKQFAALKQLIESCDIPRLKPVPAGKFVKSDLPDKVRVRVLGEGNQAWLLYLTDTGRGHRVRLDLDLPAGQYEFTWINPVTGGIAKTETLSQTGKGPLSVQSPKLPEDLALKILRKGRP